MELTTQLSVISRHSRYYDIGSKTNLMDRRRKILANEYEALTDKALREATTQCGAKVFAKVRLADSLHLKSSGISNEEYSYALRAHFDFAVARGDSMSAFAVEFDGPKHDTDPDFVRRDALKNSICDKLGMPLLRIDADFLQPIGKTRFTILGWAVELRYLYEGFCQAQETGQLPYYDEVFDYSAFLGWGYYEGDKLVEIDHTDLAKRIGKLFQRTDLPDEVKRQPIESLGEALGYGNRNLIMIRPYDPFLPARAELMRCLEKKVCLSPPEELEAEDSRGYIVSIAFVKLPGDKTIIGRGRCRRLHFPPVRPHWLSEELAILDAAEKLKSYQRGNFRPSPPEAVVAWRERINGWKAARC
jgi:hypothetical protein